MIDLTSLLGACFDGNYHSLYGRRDTSHQDKTLYMDVPVFGDSFEVPVFIVSAFSTYKDILNDFTPTSFAVSLEHIGYTSIYKSLPVKIREVLQIGYSEFRLIKIPVDSNNCYYGTLGAIFDKDLLPVMMLSWQIKKIPSNVVGKPFLLSFVQPVLRVSPKVLIDKSDALERYIVNKIIPAALQCRCQRPLVPYNSIFEPNNYQLYSPKVEVCNFPFEIKGIEAPSVSTTNRKLLDIAANNISEVL